MFVHVSSSTGFETVTVPKSYQGYSAPEASCCSSC